MIIKKRDLYILTFLVSIVGYAACQRINEGSKNDSEQISLTTTARYETTSMSPTNNQDAADDPVILTDSPESGQGAKF